MTRVSSKNFIRGGSSVIIMKGGYDMKSRCGFYSKLKCCEGVFEEIGGEVGELGRGGEGQLPSPIDETLFRSAINAADLQCTEVELPEPIQMCTH